MDQLHKFSEVHIDQDCSELDGHHENGLFFNCTFRRLNNLVLKDCELANSAFETDSVRDALGLTLTLSCKSFKRVSLSSLVFDLILMLLYMTTGNDVKREKLLDVVGRDRAGVLMRLLKATE